MPPRPKVRGRAVLWQVKTRGMSSGSIYVAADTFDQAMTIARAFVGVADDDVVKCQEAGFVYGQPNIFA